MMRRAWSALVLVALLAVGSLAAPDEALCGRLAERDEVRVLSLWGSAGQRGYAHGYLLAEDILRGMSHDLDVILRGRGAQALRAITPIVERGFRFSAEETAELEGLLAGIRPACRPGSRVLPALGREIRLVDLKLVSTVGDWYALGCSSAAVWGDRTEDGTATAVRNFDFRAIELLVRRPLVLVVAGDPDGARLGWIGIGHAGGLGTFTGMNAEGVYAAIHDVHVRPEMRDLAQPNVPRLLAMRRLLEQVPAKRASETAATKLRGWPTVYGNNILVATPDATGAPAAVLEYDGRDARQEGVDLRLAAELGEAAPRFVACSNHHRQRSRGRCDRYDRLTRGVLALRAGEKRDIAAWFALAERSAVPAAGRTVPVGGFGTLHQAVARTGRRELWLRFLTPGGNIRDAKPFRLRVREELRAVTKW
jgi:hypothetical protein